MSETTIIALLQWELGWGAERAQKAIDLMVDVPHCDMTSMHKNEILSWALAADNIRQRFEEPWL
jgi:hypothetical protein